MLGGVHLGVGYDVHGSHNSPLLSEKVARRPDKGCTV